MTPEGRSGAVPVHSLMAREKAGADCPKSLYLLSTSQDNTVPQAYELAVVQPRDRQVGQLGREGDWSKYKIGQRVFVCYARAPPLNS